MVRNFLLRTLRIGLFTPIVIAALILQARPSAAFVGGCYDETGNPTPCQTPVPLPQPTPTPDPTRRTLDNGAVNLHVFYEYDVKSYNDYAGVSTSGLEDNFPTDPRYFSTDEMWRGDAGSDQWTEIGNTRGVLNGTDYSGIFGADMENGFYEEFSISQSVSGGQDPIELAAESSNTSIVDYMYNGVVFARKMTSALYSDNVQIGLESNNSTGGFNHFASGEEICTPEIWAGTGSWTYWPDISQLKVYNDSNGAVTSSYGRTLSGAPAASFYD